MSAPAGFVFLIGFPRSGTKLLRQLLNNHPRIFLTHELLFLPLLAERFGRYGDVSQPEHFRRMHQDVMATYYYLVRRRIGGSVITAEQWHGACESFDLPGVVAALIRLETGAPATAGLWLGDKSPNYTTHLPELQHALPGARFIHIVRDVRDAALSARQVWRKNIRRFTQRWADGMERLQRDSAGLPAGTLIEVRYEDLLARPEATLRQVTDFLGLDYEPGMESLVRPSENLGDARGKTSIVGSNQQKFRSRLTQREIARLEEVAMEPLHRYGYDVQAQGPARRIPGPMMGWYAVSDVLNRFAFDLRTVQGLGATVKGTVARARTRL